MHTFGGLTPEVIDRLSLKDFLVLCQWAEDYQRNGGGLA